MGDQIPEITRHSIIRMGHYGQTYVGLSKLVAAQRFMI